MCAQVEIVWNGDIVHAPFDGDIAAVEAVLIDFDHMLSTIPTLESLRELRVSTAEGSSEYEALNAMRRSYSELGVKFFLIELNGWDRQSWEWTGWP